MAKVFGLDTEATGLDLRHGALPFLVTLSNADDLENVAMWEWDVDPTTRDPIVDTADLIEIQDAIDEADELILQNPKFDCEALTQLFKAVGMRLRWDWGKVRDTLLAGHLLASNQPHDLTTMVLVELGVNIKPYEDRLTEACNEARRLARSMFPEWAIAKAGRADMPSIKEKAHKADMWLPRAIAKALDYPEDHPWWTVCSEYANVDSVSTLPLYLRQREVIEKRGLTRIYEERLKVLSVAHKIETVGVTGSVSRRNELAVDYKAECERLERICVNLSDGKIDGLPDGRSNALNDIVFDHFKLKSNKKTDKGNPSMDKTVLEHWRATLPERSKARLFVESLGDYRSRKTAINYMDGYEKFWFNEGADTFRLHPSLNPTGTQTLRWSSSNPNEQNISKREGFNLRYVFGPAPGREWWSCDAKNIELRLPAYEAGEEEMIRLFEQPDEPPFYGSNHILVFSILHPDLWAEGIKEVGFDKVGPYVKKKYASTWYQWVKNGNFAVQYGAIEASGTADRAYHVKGGQQIVSDRFTKIKQLNQECIRFAKIHGYVETMPDRTVDPERGYPLACTQNNWGGILETVPLNYHIQGTAMWWMQGAMIRVQEYLDYVNSVDPRGFYMVMQVHDELVFDFPKGRTDPAWKENRGKIRKIQRLMEEGGANLVPSIPTPVSCEYHPVSWDVGVAV